MVAFIPATAPLGRTATVLVVDDNPALRQSAQAMLAPAGLGCVAVADSISALCALVEHRPRAVLLDAATLHQDDFVRNRHRLHLVVGYVDRRDAKFVVQVFEFGPHRNS